MNLAARRAHGFNLPELMIALTIGLMLTLAFIAVLGRCRHEMAAAESLAQLEDSARQSMDALVRDVEHAGFFGGSGGSTRQLWRNRMPIADAGALRQPDTSHPQAPVAGLPAGSHDCGMNFAVDLELPVQGANNSWPAGTEARNCDPTAAAGGVYAGADTLTVRHASLEPVKPRAGRLQLYLRRLEAHSPAALFADGLSPGPLDVDAEVRDVEVRSYYIANNSVGRPGWPALRVKALTESRGAAQFRDEEVMPGVEDLQVEFGVRDAGTAASKLRFVTPDFPALRTQRIVAVRLWLRIRADSTEDGYEDARPLEYSDVAFIPDALQATQRRLLIERTVTLRNAPVS
jgi:type IV pilus assembly protein PilW